LIAVTNIRNSKTESKSQHSSVSFRLRSRCYKYQKFKDRKQITTDSILNFSIKVLLQISEIQRPKANHNAIEQQITNLKAVTNIRNSKTESKSQLYLFPKLDFIRCYKYQKFKDRKQITTIETDDCKQLSCYKYQKFKDRKQITTHHTNHKASPQLLQISEIQRPKANHNIIQASFKISNHIAPMPVTYTKFVAKQTHKIHHKLL
jgi:hypothetical protein